MQRLNIIDRLINELQHGLQTCHTRPPSPNRDYPAKHIDEVELTEQQQLKVASLMRVNNAGEVAAQGLYRGQALTARNQAVNVAMIEAAEEENDHLNWCQNRLEELGQSRSILDGVWYWGSFAIGAIAGAAGDKWSLGFVRETELQVCKHLAEHLQQLPAQDSRTKQILETMHKDEAKHAEQAQKAGAAELPSWIKFAMASVSKVMTFVSYRI